MYLHLDDEKINSLQRQSIVRLINRAKRAHMTNIVMRIGGKDVTLEADWIKHLSFDGCDCVDGHSRTCPVYGNS